ncbi:MAG: YceD family protein [Acidimicrobiales bacterium]
MNEDHVLDHPDGKRDDGGDRDQSEAGPVDEPIGRHRPPRLVVNVGDLRRRLGQRRSEHIEVHLARQSVVASRTTNEPVRGSVVVESIERGVSVSGSLHFTWEGDCRRCLEVTGDRVEVDIYEIFQVDAPEDSELIDFDGDQIDLVPLVRDAVLLSLPLAPLCDDACAGPDPDRYPAMTAAEAERRRAEEAAVPDMRWAALDQLRLDQD